MCVQGVNTEKYVPNPKASSPQALAMFEFVGRLMGISLRHKFYLPFELAPMVRPRGVQGPLLVVATMWCTGGWGSSSLGRAPPPTLQRLPPRCVFAAALQAAFE